MMLAKQRSALAQRRLPGGIPILILVLGLPLAGLLFVVAATRLHAPEAQSPASKPARSADLVMQDHADGSITVRQAGDRRVIDVLQPATNAFLRVMLTGLVRERRAPATGRMTAVQIVTRVILIAFVRVGVVADSVIWLVWRQTATPRRSWPGRR